MNDNIHALYHAILNGPKARAEITRAETPGDRVDFILRQGKALGLSVTREEVVRFVQPRPTGAVRPGAGNGGRGQERRSG